MPISHGWYAANADVAKCRIGRSGDSCHAAVFRELEEAMTYRKIGGLHWITLGRFGLCWYVRRPKTKPRHEPAANGLRWVD